MKTRFSLLAFIVLFLIQSCEKEVQDELSKKSENLEFKSTLINQINNSFPYVLEKVKIEKGNITLFIHHQGNKSEHEYQLVWDGITYLQNGMDNVVFLALVDLTSDQEVTKKSYQKLQGELQFSDSILYTPNLLVELINLSDTTFEIQFELNDGDGSWQGPNYSDSTVYIGSDLVFQIYDSSYTDSLYDTSYLDSLYLDSLYSDSTSILIDSIYGDTISTDSTYWDSAYVDQFYYDSINVNLNDSSSLDSMVIYVPSSDSTFLVDSSSYDNTLMDSLFNDPVIIDSSNIYISDPDTSAVDSLQ